MLSPGPVLVRVQTFRAEYEGMVSAAVLQAGKTVVVDAGLKRRIGVDGPGDYILDFEVEVEEPGDVVIEVEYESGGELRRISRTYYAVPQFVLVNHLPRYCQSFSPLDEAETEFVCDGVVVDAAGVPIAGSEAVAIDEVSLQGVYAGYRAVQRTDGDLIAPVLPHDVAVTPRPYGRWESPLWPFYVRATEKYAWASADWDGAVDAGTYWARIP